MHTKYSLPFLAAASLISSHALAGDITRDNNELRNELAVGYQFGFNEDYHLALEVFGQKNMPYSNLPVGAYYNADEQTPIDDPELLQEDARNDFDWTTGIRLRPGYNVTKNTRLFLDGGVVWGDFSMELTELDSARMGPVDELASSNTVRGWRYGAGIEHHIPHARAFSLVLDYSMTDFEAAELASNNYLSNPADLNADPVNGPAYQQIMLSLKADFDPGLGF